MAPGAGQERSHAACRSFLSKTVLPMHRGARFFQKQCFPCSVALVLGSDDTQKIKQTIKLESNMFYNLLEYVENMQGTINETHKQTIKQAKRTTNNQKTHTNIQSNKRSIKQTINQAHHQSNQTIKERKQTNPKKKPYIKNYATPDRPPPAAAMLASVYLPAGFRDKFEFCFNVP